MRADLQGHDTRIHDPQSLDAMDAETGVDYGVHSDFARAPSDFVPAPSDFAPAHGFAAAHGTCADGMPVCDGVVADPGCEIYFLLLLLLISFPGALECSIFGCNIFWWAHSMRDDAGKRFGAYDCVSESLRLGHHLEIYLPTLSLIILWVDDWFILYRSPLSCAFDLSCCMDGENMYRSLGKRVLQHLEHGGVFLARLGRVKRAVVAEVEVVFYLAEVGVGVEAGEEEGGAFVVLRFVCYIGGTAGGGYCG